MVPVSREDKKRKKAPQGLSFRFAKAYSTIVAVLT